MATMRFNPYEMIEQLESENANLRELCEEIYGLVHTLVSNTTPFINSIESVDRWNGPDLEDLYASFCAFTTKYEQFIEEDN
jgi:hypothetical protein